MDSIHTKTRQWQKPLIWSASLAVVVITFAGSYLHQRPEKGTPRFNFDPRFKLPSPPVDTPYSDKGNVIAMVLTGVSGLFAVACGVRDARTTRSLLPLVLPLSGGMNVLSETMIDVLGAVYYPWPKNYVSFHILGREIVPWIPIWFGYASIMQLGLQLLHKNATTRMLWAFFGLTMILDLVLEEILLPLGIYDYYGNQPLVVLNKFPWWWMGPNAVAVFLPTALAYRLRYLLVSWKSLAVFFLTPMSVCAAYGLVAFPAWTAINDDYSWFVRDFLGLLTLLLAPIVFCGILEIVLGRHPLDMDGTGKSNQISPTPEENIGTYRDDC
ncbi:hypothetical protein AA0120_g5952 [Alternaria tenuissima]|jgi:hypothetical protein|nr:putative membrane protein [Alternaria alternata]RYN90665.1 hypothetical protein AA0120_g5952 [Alternaria tenuissima]